MEHKKHFINYQGVARNASNELMTGEAMTIWIANRSSLYEENHTMPTDANAVFSLLIGNGSPFKGDINTSGEVHTTATGSANMVPIAYGVISREGLITS